MDTEKLVRDIVANVMSRIGPDGSVAAGKASARADGSQKEPRKVVCGVSVRHVHLCPEHVPRGKRHSPAAVSAGLPAPAAPRPRR